MEAHGHADPRERAPRARAGGPEVASRSISAGAVARVVAQLEERAHQEHISIIADIARGAYVVSDPLALDVVVRNLLENALAAVSAGGRRHIALSARRTAARSSSQVARQRRWFSAGGRRAAVPEVHAPAPRRRRQLLRHRPRPLHRAAADAARGRPCQRAQRGRGAGRAFVLTWPAAPSVGGPAHAGDRARDTDVSAAASSARPGRRGRSASRGRRRREPARRRLRGRPRDRR